MITRCEFYSTNLNQNNVRIKKDEAFDVYEVYFFGYDNNSRPFLESVYKVKGKLYNLKKVLPIPLYEIPYVNPNIFHPSGLICDDGKEHYVTIFKEQAYR